MAYQTKTEDGKVLILESGGAHLLSSNLDEIWSFLLEDYGECLRICWDLDATVSAFLRLLGRTACKGLQTSKKWHQDSFRLFYIPDKVFSVSHVSGAKCNLYGLSQYYPDLDEPDVEGLQALGMKLLEELAKMGFVYVKKLTSPVAIYEEAILSKLDLPKITDIPEKVGELAYKCANRLWIEAHVLGFHDKVWSYDLSSAFPNIVKDLVDFRDCDIIHTPDYQEKAIYGFAETETTIYDWVMVHPIIRETEEALESTTGTWPDERTKGQIDFINRWKIGEVKILDGWWIIPKYKLVRKPFLVPLRDLLKYKQGSEVQKILAKRSSTGIWGKMLEDRGDSFGPYANFIWAAETSSQVALQVAEFLYSHKIGPDDNEGYKHLLHISVDGVMLDCPIEEIGLVHCPEET